MSSTFRTGALFIFALLGLTACTADGAIVPPVSNTAGPSISNTTAPLISDPLTQLRSADAGFTIDVNVTPAIHSRGNGPTKFSLNRPELMFSGITFFVTCAPAGRFTMTLGKSFSGTCSPNAIEVSGGIPLGASAGELRADISVAQGTKFWLVGIPTQPKPNQ